MPQTTYTDNPAAAFAGMLADGSPHTIVTAENTEASAEIAFGRAVEFGASEREANLPDAETDKIMGIVVFEHRSSGTNADLGTTGLKPGAQMSVLRKGPIWVIVEDGCAIGDRLWVRAVAGGDPEFLGGINNADDSTDMVDCTKQGVFLTAASAGGLAVLDVDFTNEPD